MSAVDCPGQEYWEGLLAATLPAEQQTRCERHLECCAACQDRLDRAGRGDALLRLARRLGAPTVAPRDPLLAGVLRDLREVRSPLRTDPDEPLDLYFLGPAARMG